MSLSPSGSLVTQPQLLCSAHTWRVNTLVRTDGERKKSSQDTPLTRSCTHDTCALGRARRSRGRGSSASTARSAASRRGGRSLRPTPSRTGWCAPAPRNILPRTAPRPTCDPRRPSVQATRIDVFGSRRLSREGAAGTIRHEETRDSAIGRGRVGIDAASGLGFGARRCGRSQAECIRFPSEPLMCADGTAPRCSVMRAELGERQRSVTLALFCVRYVCVYRARGRQRVSASLSLVSAVTRGVWVVSQARREKDGKSVKDDPRRSRATPPDVFSDTGEGL